MLATPSSLRPTGAAATAASRNMRAAHQACRQLQDPANATASLCQLSHCAAHTLAAYENWRSRQQPKYLFRKAHRARQQAALEEYIHAALQPYMRTLTLLSRKGSFAVSPASLRGFNRRAADDLTLLSGMALGHGLKCLELRLLGTCLLRLATAVSRFQKFRAQLMRGDCSKPQLPTIPEEGDYCQQQSLGSPAVMISASA